MADPRLAADIEHALRTTSLRLLAREISISEALATVGSVLDGTPEERRVTPRELMAEGRKAYRDRVLAEIAQYERDGRGRDAVSIVVDKHVRDRRDPIEVESLTRKFRRWRHAEKRTCVRPTSGK